MVVTYNGVVGSTVFSNKKISGILFGAQNMAVLTGLSYGEVPL